MSLLNLNPFSDELLISDRTRSTKIFDPWRSSGDRQSSELNWSEIEKKKKRRKKRKRKREKGGEKRLNAKYTSKPSRTEISKNRYRDEMVKNSRLSLQCNEYFVGTAARFPVLRSD